MSSERGSPNAVEASSNDTPCLLRLDSAFPESTYTLSIQVHERIRSDILAGQWAPDDKLAPAVLAERYQTSTTVVREALTRLAGEKLVQNIPNRGFSVPRLSLDELRDLTELRCVCEALGI